MFLFSRTSLFIVLALVYTVACAGTGNSTSSTKTTSGEKSSSSDGNSAGSSSAASSALSSAISAGTGAMAGFTTMLSSFGSMVPSVLSSAVPVVLMMGLGALLVPVFGLNSLLRAAMQRRSMPNLGASFGKNNVMTPYINQVNDILQKITVALDGMEKRYGH